GVDLQFAHLVLDFLDPVTHLRRLSPHRGRRAAQEVRHGHARHLDRVLHGEEQSRTSTLVHTHLEDVLTVEQNLPRGHRVIGVSRDGVRQRRFPGAVRPHDRVHLTTTNREVHALEDLLAALFRVNGGMQILDFQRGHCLVRFSLLWHGGRWALRYRTIRSDTDRFEFGFDRGLESLTDLGDLDTHQDLLEESAHHEPAGLLLLDAAGHQVEQLLFVEVTGGAGVSGTRDLTRFDFEVGYRVGAGTLGQHKVTIQL